METREDIHNEGTLDIPVQLRSYTPDVEVPNAEVILVSDLDEAEFLFVIPKGHPEHRRVWNKNEWYLICSAVGDESTGSACIRATDETSVRLLSDELDLRDFWAQYGEVVLVEMESYHDPNFDTRREQVFVHWRDCEERVLLAITVSIRPEDDLPNRLLGLFSLAPSESSLLTQLFSPESETKLWVMERNNVEVLNIEYNFPMMLDGFGSYWVSLPIELLEKVRWYPSLNQSPEW